MVSVRSALRAVFAVCVLLSAGVVVSGYVTHSPAGTTPRAGPTGPDAVNRSSPQPSTSGLTVVTTDSNRPGLGLTNGSRAEAEIVAYDRNGSVRYYNDTYDRYWDVDPVVENETNGTDGNETPETGSMTVEYVASERLNASACGLADERGNGEDGNGEDGNDKGGNGGGKADEASGANGGGEAGVCARNVIERVNLSTGAVTPIYAEVAPRAELAPWNDVDRINDTHYVVADRTENRVFVVDTRTGEYAWEWYASAAFPFDSGGYYIEDWTHMNDVEYLPDGRIMASVRNHDQVVFLDPERPPERAVVEGWTLGNDSNRSVLYEPYNPDYIPRENGGPAVVVADAENNRVVEYAYHEGSWERTWQWGPPALQWPRDADRLPNGHTLVVDSNGDRVVEVGESGEVVWNVSVGLPYDAERLGTGPESASGPSAERIATRTSGKRGRADTDGDPADGEAEEAADPVASVAKRRLSGPALSAVLYVSPAWVGVVELLALGVLAVTGIGWFLAESYWRSVVAGLGDRAEGIDRR